MKQFFLKIVGFLHILFGFDLDKWCTEHVQPAIEIAERLKQFINSPVADLIVHLIPGTVDDEVKNFIAANIGKAIDILEASPGANTDLDFTNKVVSFVNTLKNSSDAVKGAILKTFAREYAKLNAVNDAAVRDSSIDLLVQLQYAKFKNGLEAPQLPWKPVLQAMNEVPENEQPGIDEMPAATQNNEAGTGEPAPVINLNNGAQSAVDDAPQNEADKALTPASELPASVGALIPEKKTE